MHRKKERKQKVEQSVTVESRSQSTKREEKVQVSVRKNKTKSQGKSINQRIKWRAVFECIKASKRGHHHILPLVNGKVNSLG